MNDPLPEAVDVLILGAGPVGMTLHLALAAGGQRSRLVDRRSGHAQRDDPRALALSYGARQLLAQINSWPQRAATPIEHIHISHQGGFGRTVIDHHDYDLPALGYVVRYRDLAAALASNLAADAVVTETEVLDIQRNTSGLTVALRQGDQQRRIQTKLLIHAEGTPGDDPEVHVHDYHQHAVICEVGLDAGANLGLNLGPNFSANLNPNTHPNTSPNLHPTGRSLADKRAGHHQRAWERFTPDGPLALLPLGDQYSVVFTLPPAKADAVMLLDDAAFLAVLQQQFGPRLRFTTPGRRSRFPLFLRLRHTIVRDREVWIGNTAQTLHPVSGQGFNLGIRDAWQLAEIVLKNGVDRSDLAAYASARRLDRQGSAFFTDQIVRLFSNDIAPVKLARGIGLLALDLCPAARHFIAKRMIWGARAWP
jgi:2-octaprenyl-6-methoxyphenol hydroxylase